MTMAGPELTGLVGADLLEQRAADAKGHRALELAFDHERIEEPAGVVAEPDAEDADACRELIQLDQGQRGLERIGDVARLEEARAQRPRSSSPS